MSLLSIGFSFCALSVLAGAFGAHALAERLAERELALWETAARYLMYSGLLLVAVALVQRLDESTGLARWPGVTVAVGGAIFSGTVFALALGGPRWLGAVTPIGGTLLIVGLVAMAWFTLRWP